MKIDDVVAFQLDDTFFEGIDFQVVCKDFLTVTVYTNN